MDSNFKKCLDSLNDNETEIRSDALRILSRLCDNIISFPTDKEYRKIRVDDPRITNTLLKAYGAIECLFEIGFIEDGEYFSLPSDTPLSRLRQIQKALHDLQARVQTVTTDNKIYQQEKRSRIGRNDKFFGGIVDKFRHILIYENPQLRNKARRIIPLEKLQIGAMNRMRQLQKEISMNKSDGTVTSTAEHEITMDDLLLVELLDWFKNEFFTWMDSPNCNVCGKTCTYDSVELSMDPRIARTEIHKMLRRYNPSIKTKIECEFGLLSDGIKSEKNRSYRRCEDCGIEAKFPRYTDPGILLKTRRGRCGEWANAFTLICRTLDFDARVVHDETDHVWTEVWSIASNRWIHADPCENVVDRPLLYERGWKKKLTYVIAYSKDEVQDVTWRYTRDQAAVMKRRTLCTENDLCSLICTLNNERQNSLGYSEVRRCFVTKRRALELVELMPAPPGATKPGEEADGEYEGRSSGSLAWRMSRGETKEIPSKPKIWQIRRDTKRFEIRYNTAKDEYETLENDVKILEKRLGWQNGAETIKGGIFRKVENDWKVTYLARSPGQTKGRITWCFETLESEKSIKFFELRAKCACFHGGIVQWTVEGSYRDSKKLRDIITIDNYEHFQTELLNGSSKVVLTAEISGGDGELAWQHAQLFRQNLRDSECAMTIVIET